MNSPSLWRFWTAAPLLVFALCAAAAFLIGPPAAYPSGSLITIPSGTTIAGAGGLLKEAGALRSPLMFELAVRAGKGSIAAGTYALPERESALSLAYRLSHGKTGLAQARVTIPEGTTVAQAADILKVALRDFDTKGFIALAKQDEGYLFPDTYFFLPGTPPETAVQTMRDNFDRHIAPLETQIRAFGRSEADAVIMASLLEKEARQSETRRIVAGILWKRLAIGMPLQTDAVFGYITGTPTHSPSAAELAVDSPYNTYTYKGLPPGPIGNPGAEAIQDAVTPIKTPYLYYVTDKEGNIYYAKTYAEHLANIQKAR